MTEWKPFNGLDTPDPLPPTHRWVLLAFPSRLTGARGPVVVAGYLKYGAGDKGSPYWVTPSFDRGAESNPSHWADVLPDDFEFPGRTVLPRISDGKSPARIAFEHQLLTQKLGIAIENHRVALDELQEVLSSITEESAGGTR